MKLLEIDGIMEKEGESTVLLAAIESIAIQTSVWVKTCYASLVDRMSGGMIGPQYLLSSTRSAFKKILMLSLASAMAVFAGEPPVWSLPGLLPEFQRQREMTASRWIWCDGNSKPEAVSLFRFAFTADSPVKDGRLFFSAVDEGTLYLNGSEIKPAAFAKAVRPGRNVIAVRVRNILGSSGLIMFGDFTLQSGDKLSLRSCRAFRAHDGKIPPDGWEEPDFDDSAWTPAEEIGDACALPFSRHRDYTRDFATAEERTAIAEMERRKSEVPALPSGLDNEPESNAKVVYEGFRPLIDVNGERLEPDWNLCGSAHDYALNSIVKTRALGFRFFRIKADMHVVETAPGVYDFSTLDQQARLVLKYASDAKLLLGLRLRFSKWCKKHPEDCVGYATGPAKDKLGDERIEPLVRPSAAAPGIRRETEHFFTCLGEYLKDKPWRKRIVAVRPCWGIYTEWHCYGMYEAPDVGPAMTAAFRRYKGGIYAHDDPPTAAERTEGAMLLDPAKKRKVLDFYACMAEQISDYLLFSARQSKRILPGRLVGAYYGYVFAVHPPEGANAMLEKVLAAPEIDFLSDPTMYTAASRRGGGSYYHRTVTATFHRFGKLPIIEDDMRFHHITKYQPQAKRIATETPRESQMTMRRNYLNKLFDGCGIQLCDPSGSRHLRLHFHDDPAVSLGLYEAMAAVRKAGTLPIQSGNDTVVVVSTAERFRRDGAPKHVDPRTTHIYLSPEFLYNSGMTFDICTLEDFLASSNSYKRVVLLNIFGPSAGERAALKARLRRPGVSALWLVAPGCATEKGFSDEAMYDLTGLALKGAAASPNVTCDGAAPFPLGGAMKLLDDGSIAAFIPKPPKQPAQWRDALAALGQVPVAALGTYVRRHGNLVLFHVAKEGTYTLNLPLELKHRKAVELVTGETFAAGPVLTIATDGCDTRLFKFAE